MTGAQNVEIRAIDRAAQKLIVTGYLPPAFTIDPYDSRPLWDISGISALFDRRPDELLELLLANGPAHLPKRDIPSSWRALVES